MGVESLWSALLAPALLSAATSTQLPYIHLFLTCSLPTDTTTSQNCKPLAKTFAVRSFLALRADSELDPVTPRAEKDTAHGHAADTITIQNDEVFDVMKAASRGDDVYRLDRGSPGVPDRLHC